MTANANSALPDPARVRRVVTQVVLLVAAAAAVMWLLFALRMILLLLAFTAIFCYLIAPLVEFFEFSIRIGKVVLRVPHTAAIIIVYLLLAGAAALALEKVAPLLSDQLNAFFENMPNYAKHLEQYAKQLSALPNRYRFLPISWRQSLTDGVNGAISSLLAWLQSVALGTVRLASYLVWLVLIPVLGFFFLKDAKTISDRFLSTLPAADMRYRAAVFLKDVSETMAAYIRAQLLACLLVGVVLGVGLWLLGLPYPLVFAVGAGLFEFVPVVGPLSLGAVAVLVASFHSWRNALLVFGFLAIYRMIHDYVIYPRLISRGVEVHPVVVILAVLSGAELGGVAGVFLSVPVAALLIVCFRHWRDLRQDRSIALVGPDNEPLVEGLIADKLILASPTDQSAQSLPRSGVD
ncbi:MAG TPA: AI-2E family transporter [Blastocatellia bacterium]|nr:AI-2E family transporter [Blastocatellia bacterium]